MGGVETRLWMSKQKEEEEKKKSGFGTSSFIITTDERYWMHKRINYLQYLLSPLHVLCLFRHHLYAPPK